MALRQLKALLDVAAQLAKVASGLALVAGVTTYAQNERNEWSKSYGDYKTLRDEAFVKVGRLQAAAKANVVAATTAQPENPPPPPKPPSSAEPVGVRLALELAAWMVDHCQTADLRRPATSEEVVSTCQLVHRVRAAGRDLLQRRNTKVALATEWFVNRLRLMDDQKRLDNELANVLETASSLDAANYLMRIYPAKGADSAVPPPLPLARASDALAINVLAKDQVVYATFLRHGIYGRERLEKLAREVREMRQHPAAVGDTKKQELLDEFLRKFVSVHKMSDQV